MKGHPWLKLNIDDIKALLLAALERPTWPWPLSTS